MQKITPRSENFSTWYQDVIKAADLAENSVVRGCMVIKPWGMQIWQRMRDQLNQKIESAGYENAAFPLLVPLSFLEKEAAHVEGFAKECAVVTHHRLETNSTGKLEPAESAKLEEPYVIRPTSETLIGDCMSRWVQSYKDLPLKINQWCNVMRWEMRTRLFLRTSEFFWHEAHAAFADDESAIAATEHGIETYQYFFEQFLSIPVHVGKKTAAERFPGAQDTYTIEAMMQDGKALQGGTSHFLGESFSKAYDITYLNANQKQEYAKTISWGVTTRMIGALVMVHGDDDGIVLPPTVAPVQVIIIPILKKNNPSSTVIDTCREIEKKLSSLTFADENIRVKLDMRENRTAQDKYWEAVKKGIPIRIEIGERDIENNIVSISFRHEDAKTRITCEFAHLAKEIPEKLQEIQQYLWKNALTKREDFTQSCDSVDQLKAIFQEPSAGLVFACMHPSAEAIKENQNIFSELKITPRCIMNTLPKGKCIFTQCQDSPVVLFAKAY